MKNLTKKAKIALGSAGAGVLALAVALGVWQPWNQPDDPVDDPDELQGEVLPPAGDEEESLTLNVGGEKIPCTIFEGDGWQIYVLEDWQVDEAEDGSVTVSAPESAGKNTSISVQPAASNTYRGDFVSVYPIQTEEGTSIARVFYSAAAEGGWQVTCRADEDDWDESQKLMTAVVRTMSVGEEKIFSGLSPVASEPDWQIMDGDTLLWMDKDAYIVDDALKAEVEAGMMEWDNATKSNFTGQYRMDDLTWAGSYTCLTEQGYVDVFQSQVWYEVAEGKEEALSQSEGDDIVDGWLRGGAPVVALFHDGSAVAGIQIFWEDVGTVGGADFAAELIKD